MEPDTDLLPLASACPAGSELVAGIALSGRVGPRVVYSYRVPESLRDLVEPGLLVQVPFGPRTLQGVVLTVGHEDPGNIRLRDVTCVLDPVPCLTSCQIDLARWTAMYYLCGLGEALGVMLPAGLDRAMETLYAPKPDDAPDTSRLSSLRRSLLDAVYACGPASAERLGRALDPAKAKSALDDLARRGFIDRHYRLGRPAVTDRTETLVVLQPGATPTKLGARQRALVEYLQERGREAPLSDLRDELGISRDSIAALAARRIVVTYERQVRRDPLAHRHIPSHPAPKPTDEQERAYRPIAQALERHDGSIFLLHGITGSGKTEVYLRAVADTLAAGRQAIVLVPEIGLTPQTVTRFAGRFPGQVALLHSKLGDGERFDEWQRIRRSECSVAVGPRSAIFSPFAHLGLIVIDEEHDASYKQDSVPRYHTRDIAEHLAGTTGAVVILGSATPDVVSYYRAQRGEFHLLTMKSRAGPGPSSESRMVPISAGRPGDAAVSPTVHQMPRHVPGSAGVSPAPRRPPDENLPTTHEPALPSVQIVDMRLELKAGNRSIFSRLLRRELQNTLERGEQAILFLNRRGNATFVNCRDCGFVVKCHHCDVPFTYHSDGNTLLCHRCDARAPLPRSCASCGSWRIRFFGLGTQRVEQEVLAQFPAASVQRFDRDVTTSKLSHEAILDRFALGDIDILVGTQIVAKGLDFPKVTLVGAVSADTSINLPDFRAAERTFSLLTQVAGRAGRAELPGMVVVQTYAPSHFAIQAAAQHDYKAFFQDEITYRREGLYPPFSRLARLVRSDRAEHVCRTEAHRLAEQLREWMAVHPQAGIDLIGPAPCFISKAHDHYFWQILLRGHDLYPLLATVPTGWAIDVDPVNLL